MPISDVLTRTLEAAGIPVYGVSVGNEADKQTWRIDFTPAATIGQRNQATGIVASFSLADPAVVTQEANNAAKSLDDRRIQALATAVHKRFKLFVPGDTMTPAQWRASLRAEFDALG
jgi:hypothetical protein